MATKTIGSGARDFATLAAWASYVNALTLSAPEVGQCFNDSQFTVSSKVSLGGWSGGSGTNTVTLTCGAGQSFRDNAGKLSNALRYNQSNGVGVSCSLAYDAQIEITTAFFILDGLQIKTTGNAVAAVKSTVDNTTVQNCIIQGTLFGASNFLLNFESAASGASNLAQNNLILLTGAAGQCLHYIFGGTSIGNTLVASNSPTVTTAAIQGSYTPNIVVKNTAVYGFGSKDFSGTAGSGSTNNATDQATHGGTGFGASGQASLVGATEWESVTNGSEDFRLKATSAKLKNNGATVGLSADIVGTARAAPYDIGCWEMASTVKLRRYSALNGLGASGPFFNDIL